jgi:hypothetical protein
MSNHKRRVRAIELNLTPKQIVILWLRNARQVGNFLEARLNPKSPREMIATHVSEAVRESMKGQSESLAQRAVLQARKEADSLYNLIVTINAAVFETRDQHERERIFLAGYLSAVINGKRTKDRIQYLRSAVLMCIEPVIILDAAINQVVAERLSGQPALFRDSEVVVAETLQIATDFSKWFNALADYVGATPINLEDFRSNLQAEIDRRIAIWVNCASLTSIASMGKPEEINSALTRHFLLIDREAGERDDVG